MSIHKIVDRASKDPEFLSRLSADPFGTAKAEGYDINGDHVKAALGMHGASDQQIVETLQARLSHSSKGNPSPIESGGITPGGSSGLGAATPLTNTTP